MTTIEQVTEAQKKMIDAQSELATEPEGTDRHRRLGAALKRATNEYIRLVLALET